MVYAICTAVFLFLLFVGGGFLLYRNQPQMLTGFSSSLALLFYRQRRVLVSLLILTIFLLGLFFQSGLAAGTLQQVSSSLVQVITMSGGGSAVLQLAAHSDPQPQMLQNQAQGQIQVPSGAMRIVRVNSAARDQYATPYEWQVWAYSSCSGIAMETVMNAYGRHLIASDVLQVEQNLGVWNVSLGLLRDDGIAETAAYLGFDTSASHSLTIDQVVAIANQGKPVIVSVRGLDFPAGHIFVIWGGDAQSVFVADSSLFNLHSLTRGQFGTIWQGFSAVLTPRI